MPPTGPVDGPRVSVVVAIHDTIVFVDVVQALAASSGAPRPQEVIVCDASGSPQYLRALDRIEPAAAAAVDLRTIRLPEGGRAHAWNAGVRAATGDLILLLGDDFVPTPGLPAEHVRLHRDRPQEHVVGVGPGILPDRLRRDPFRAWLEDCGRLFGVSMTRGTDAELNAFFYGANTSIKRSFLMKSGLFDEEFGAHSHEDFELGRRLQGLGMETVWLKNAVAIHEHAFTFSERSLIERIAGREAVVFDRALPKLTGPWKGNPLVGRTRAACAQVLHALTGNRRWREAEWAARLDVEQAEGYREALAARANRRGAAGNPSAC